MSNRNDSGREFWMSRPSVLALALAAATTVGAGPAFAQTEDETIVVTGYRASLAGALEVKRNSSGVVDAILAEDIADFPDSNLAEAIQRIPGVALLRADGGEGKQISVRGLNAGFTRVRINGIESQANTGGSDIQGGVNRGRGFDFSVFAAELFNSIEVRKTSSADVEEGSLGATVDLTTGRPFDFDGFTLAGGVQGAWNDLHRSTDPRATFLISNTFADDTFGALFSVAYSKRGVRDEGYTAVDIVRADTNRSFPANTGFCSPIGATSPTAQSPTNDALRGTTATDCSTGNPRLTGQTAIDAYADVFSRFDTSAPNNAGSGSFHPRIPRYLQSITEYDRLGATAALQWRPSDRTSVNFDWMYSEFDVTRWDSYIQAISFGRDVNQGGKPHTSIVDAEFAADGSWVYGDFTGVDIRSEALEDKFTTYFTQHVLSLEHAFSDNFRIDGLIGRMRSDHNSPYRSTIQVDVRNEEFSWDFRNNNDLPLLTYGFDVSDASLYEYNTQLPDGQVRGAHVGLTRSIKYTFDTAELNAAYDFTPNFTLRAGYSYRNNEFDHYEIGFATSIPSQNYFATTPLSSVMNQVSGFGRGLDLPAGAPTSWAKVDLQAFLGVVPFHGMQGDFRHNAASDNPRTVAEEINAVYLQGDFNFDMAGITVRGDAGVRYIETELLSGGMTTLTGTRAFTTVPFSYEDTLPSLNLAAELTDDLLLRFSAARVMSRPDYGSLPPGFSGLNATTTFIVNLGTPDLEPVRANTYDLQLEWYFAEDALLSFGIFYKDIDSFIQGSSENIPWSQTGLPDSLLRIPPNCVFPGGAAPPAGTPVCAASPDTIFRVNKPTNTPGGPLEGFEISYQQPFSFLPGLWGNFGLLANYTYVDSDITYFTVSQPDNPATPQDERGPVTATLTGLSKNAYNATLYYEDDRLSARVSAAYRDDYITSVQGLSTGHDVRGTAGTMFIDSAASYNVTDNLRLTFEGLNLTDEFQRLWVDSERDDTLFYNHSGRTFVFGVNYRY